MKLTRADKEAIKMGNAGYILNKGAELYRNENFKEAIEYYHLASTMGSDIATSNLGYCYLYGRSIEANVDLAISYFELAANRGNVDALYKLGDIYSSDKWKLKDSELSLYYYQLAANILIGCDWSKEDAIAFTEELEEYPSLCYALARELMPGGNLNTSLDQAYQFLLHAEQGFVHEILNGATYYKKNLNKVTVLLQDDIFDEIRDDYDYLFDEDDDDLLYDAFEGDDPVFF